ncbi:MAG: hypothetical protein QNJ70_21805 [Xenococcaceae cyanobacterium MO_207.B15]|nr:hypothetical protein [Xenococcaceae cyanobacterium MO_207.B15]
MNSINLNFYDKLHTTYKYLSKRSTIEPSYQTLINELETLLENWRQTPIKITIIGHCEILIEQIKTLKESNLKSHSLWELQTATLPNNLEKIVRNCDLLCLVNDGSKPVSDSEHKLITKAVTSNVVSYCLILTDSTTLSASSEVEVGASNTLLSCNQLTSYVFPRDLLEKIDLLTSQELREYHNFWDSILDTTLINTEKKFQEQCCNLIHRYFEQNKNQEWLQVQQYKKIFFSNQRADKFKQQLNKSCNKLNQIIHHTFKTIKQEINQSKIELINPFMYDTMMYRVQAAIENSSVIQYQEKNQTYLSLVVKYQDYNQSIHSYVMELCQHEIDSWLEKQWSKIDNADGQGMLNELIKNINQELEFITPLSSNVTISKIPKKFEFEISDYVTLSILEENNQILFDYHYTQSTWFRLILIFIIVLCAYQLFGRAFGFVILFFQLINWFTGRDIKTVKLKKQTKELKRIMDNKCQFLVKFVADKFLQNLLYYLEQESQQYQKEISFIIKQVEPELEELTQKMEQHKEYIDILKEDHTKVMQILQD